MHQFLKIFGVITTFGMLVVIIQGALVTQTGSGDACGAEWPLCYGQLIPEDPTIKTLIEYTHRLVSGILGLMVIIHSVWSWIALRHIKETKLFAILAVLFIIFQGLLGAAAVVWGQSDAVMALHFGFSLISFTSVLLLTILAFENGKNIKYTVPAISRKVKYYYFITLAYVYAVVYTGAYVKHTDAGVGCTGWPLCNGQIIPVLEGRTGIQFGHRVAAGLLFIMILISLIVVIKHYYHEKTLFYGTLLSFIFITLQVISGAIVIFTGFTLNATLFHAFMVSLLFGVVSYTALLAYRSK
ncbi:COX15/CtaA family protein [Salipaludibacillus aurantiacus]|uniref:Heme A synthase n=1 Tax=Salipaludibacillus aurantiacus TaxID=1601833 RepID=A0A1H9X159_9BACI|nr:heme A synthase [Salipaludibacillus aurantiacus]SES39637.1 cytochrome c oxidase assembly protein subunit 15 [Salipaludibacillus aurantiacus]